MRRKSHAACEVGENLAITSKGYLSLLTLPQNPGVVPALNPAMDSTQSITLPTGEVIHRHPDCIIVGTTNVDLEGCRNMNRATRS